MTRLSPALTKCLLAGLLCSSFLPALSAQTHKTTPLPDWKIEAKVQAALASEHAFQGSSIISSVNQGVVSLTGNVRSEAEKALASSELGSIQGVKSVDNDLAVVSYGHGSGSGMGSGEDRGYGPPARQNPPVAKVISLPTGSTIPVRLTEEIDTKTAKTSDTFHGTTASTLTFSGYTLIPAGTPVTGRVVEAKAATHFSGAAELAVELVSIRLPGPTGPQDVSVVTQQLSSKAAGRGANTAAKAAGGAGFGAIVGALAGGGAGAGIGAASGGALGLGANAITRGKEIDLKPEQLLQFRTASPLDVTIEVQNGQQVAARATGPISLQPRAGIAATDTPNTFVDLPGQANPATFDIVSLRLGMTAKEADAALAARFPAMQKGYPMPSNAQFTPGQKYTAAVSRNTEQFTVLLNFAETYPFDPTRPEQLTGIFYTPVTPSEADRQQFRESVFAKYGQPYREVKGISAVWCNKGVSLGSGPLACAPDQPTLTLKGTELILGDNGPIDRARAAWNRRTTSNAPPL